MRSILALCSGDCEGRLLDDAPVADGDEYCLRIIGGNPVPF